MVMSAPGKLPRDRFRRLVQSNSMAMGPTVSIIIPNWNGQELLERNLPQVLAVTKEAGEIIVVDDGSTDDSVNILREKFPMIRVLQKKSHEGFASTVNQGVRAASSDIVVLLNTDVEPEKNFLAPLILNFDSPQVFAVGCMDKSVEGGKEILRGRGIGFWKRGFLIHSRGEVDKNNTLWVSGGSGAFRKSIWEKLGGLNELYNPFYWEDIDLSYRALKSGYKILFEPKSVVIHEHSIGIIKTKYSQKKIKRIAYRNQFIFVWENATDFNLQFKHLLWLPYHFLNMLRNGDVAFIIGFFRAFILFPKIIKSKSKAQKFFVKKDKDVIEENGLST